MHHSQQEWTAWLQAKGGERLLAPIPYTHITCGRVVDDMTKASISMPWSDGLEDDLLQEINNLQPFVHEIGIYRDYDLAWAGPLTNFSFTNNAITFNASDLFQIFERRLNPKLASFDGTDIADIFRFLVEQEVARDPAINLTLTISPTGITIDRDIAENARIADELRSLARSGIDFSMVGRELLCGGKEIAGEPLIFTDADITDAAITYEGSSLTTQATVQGQRPRASKAPKPPTATAGGSDVTVGLLQQLVTDTTVKDEREADAAAQSILKLNSAPVPSISFKLREGHEYDLQTLLAGIRANFYARIGPKVIADQFRVKSVGFDVSVSQVTTVSYSFVLQPLGAEATTIPPRPETFFPVINPSVPPPPVTVPASWDGLSSWDAGAEWDS